MTANPTMTIRELCREVAGLVTQGDEAAKQSYKATRKADEHYIAAGRLLIELKGLKEPGTGPTWSMLMKQIGISESRSYELIQLAKGKVAPDELRARKRASVKRARATAEATAPRGLGCPILKAWLKASPKSREAFVVEHWTVLNRIYEDAVADIEPTVEGDTPLLGFCSGVAVEQDDGNVVAFVPARERTARDDQ